MKARGNLPAELTSLVGRRREVAAIRGLLADARVVTLTGPGGVGKTRLALRAAAHMHRAFPDGVYLVELDRLHQEALVPAAVVAALGLLEQPGPNLTGSLAAQLAEARVLLVLDNCEHLRGGVAKLVEALARDTENLAFLATSRQPLGIEPEVLVPVGPLATSAPASARTAGGSPDPAAGDAVTLFVERGGAAVWGFTLTEHNRAAVAGICARVEGLPLGIELAAAWLRTLSPQAILGRLTSQLDLLTRGSRTAPVRQQTLRGCLQWSYDLCSGPERLLWERLSVFAGEFDAEAVQHVCADGDIDEVDVPALLAFLADKSILIRRPDPGGIRFRMLDSIRAFGADRSREGGRETAARRRHRQWYQDLVRHASQDWISERQVAWLHRLDVEQPNIRLALEHGLTDPDDPLGPDAALEMAADLGQYWTMRGLRSEGQHWLARGLDRPGPPTRARLIALYYAHVLDDATGDLATAAACNQRAHQVAHALGDPVSLAIATSADAVLARLRGDLAGMAARYEETLPTFEAHGETTWQGLTLMSRVLTKVIIGDHEGAATDHAKVLALSEPHGESVVRGFSTMALGIGQWLRADLDAAEATMRQAVQLLHPTGNVVHLCWALEASGWIAASQERFPRAAVLLGTAQALTRQMGTWSPRWPDLRNYHEQVLARTRQALGKDRFQAGFDEGLALPLDAAIALANDHGARPAAMRSDPSTDKPSAPDPATAGPLAALTPREREVAHLVADGLTNKQIADRLVVSPRTAESHVQRILIKLGCTTRTQIVSTLRSPPP